MTACAWHPSALRTAFRRRHSFQSSRCAIVPRRSCALPTIGMTRRCWRNGWATRPRRSSRSWIAQAGNSALVAIEDGNIQAVGAVTDIGNITLNYVSPDARFHGVSRGLLGALEARAAGRGNTRCTLTSTETARRFYLANGYAEDAQPAGNSRTGSGYPMSRVLAPHPNRGPA